MDPVTRGEGGRGVGKKKDVATVNVYEGGKLRARGGDSFLQNPLSQAGLGILTGSRDPQCVPQGGIVNRNKNLHFQRVFLWRF